MSQETVAADGTQPLAENPADDLSKKIEAEAVLLGRSAALEPEREKSDLSEEGFLLERKQQQELRRLTAEVDKLIQDNRGRLSFSRNIFLVTVLWLAFVMAVVVQCARGVWKLSDSVLIALITTTTATVIGIFIIVANYLFNRYKST